jgi:hypothetical protein
MADPNPSNAPWWAVHIPDIRAWATLGMFVLVFYVITLIAFVPGVGVNELFKTIATLLLGSGAFGLVCAFLWGGSKASVAAADTVNVMAKGSVSQGGSTQQIPAPLDPSAPPPPPSKDD